LKGEDDAKSELISHHFLFAPKRESSEVSRLRENCPLLVGEKKPKGDDPRPNNVQMIL
jgi:hypothetical protein